MADGVGFARWPPVWAANRSSGTLVACLWNNRGVIHPSLRRPAAPESLAMGDHLALLPLLVAKFPRWLDHFVDHGPFTRREQLTCHVKAIALRRKHASAAAASEDSAFVEMLYDTLRAWGVGSRGSILVPLAEFGLRLRSWSATLEPLEPLRIDADDLDVKRAIGSIWRAVESISVVRNNAPLVAGSKTLHHLLPDLVPPMDRAYTQTFFGWHNPQFQYDQANCFRLAYTALASVAQRVKASEHVGNHPWHSSVSKVLDNGLVGLVCAIQDGSALRLLNEDGDGHVAVATGHDE